MMDVPADNELPDPWTGESCAARLSLARAHHLRSGARPARQRRRHRRGGDAGRRAVRHGRARGFFARRRERRLFRPRRMDAAAHGAALRPSRARRRRGRRVPRRLRIRGADARALRFRRLSGGERAGVARRGRARTCSAKRARFPTPPTGPSAAPMCSMAATKSAFRSIRSGPPTRSTSSASTIMRRSPIGATATAISTPRSPQRSTMPRICAPICGPGRRYDFYYADDDARRAQARTPITDGAYAKPWVHRAKDLWSWWREPHVERVGGVELGAPDRLGPGVQADPADRGRLPGGGQGLEPAQRLSRREILGRRLSAFLQPPPRRPDPAPLSRGGAVGLRSGLGRH